MIKMSTSVKHTTLHASFSDEKITPATMTDLIHKVEQHLGNIELLVGKAADTTEQVRHDFRDDMINAQANKEAYQDTNTTTLHSQIN